MTVRTRWTIAILVVVAALVAGLVTQLHDDPPTIAAPQAAADREHRDADTPAALEGPRARADLMRCPVAEDGPGGAVLRGVVVEGAADGSPVDVAPALAGTRVVLNLWANWCGPCMTELPAMAIRPPSAPNSWACRATHCSAA